MYGYAPGAVGSPFLNNNGAKVNYSAWTERINLMDYSEDQSTNWFSYDGITKSTDYIVYNKIKLYKVNSNNFYNSIVTAKGVGLNIVAGKKYLCSCYVYTEELPKIYYPDNKNYLTSNIHKQVYVDSLVRRVSFITDGSATGIYWLLQGNSHLNVNGLLNIYMGGFMVEEILTTTLNSIAGVGDSTMAGSAFDGTNWDLMVQSEWLKLAGAKLNAEIYNRAIGGNTTVNMIARWATDITPLASVCKYIIINAGINDLDIPATADDIITRLTTMTNMALADGFIPVIGTLTPCNKTGTKETYRQTVNTWIRSAFARVIDLDAIVRDPNDPSKLNPAVGWIGDGVHFGQLAKNAISDNIATLAFWDFVKPTKYQRVPK
jgi:lysophospholipase L1-like esterase